MLKRMIFLAAVASAVAAALFVGWVILNAKARDARVTATGELGWFGRKSKAAHAYRSYVEGRNLLDGTDSERTQAQAEAKFRVS